MLSCTVAFTREVRGSCCRRVEAQTVHEEDQQQQYLHHLIMIQLQPYTSTGDKFVCSPAVAAVAVVVAAAATAFSRGGGHRCSDL